MGSMVTALLSYPRNWLMARALGPEALGTYVLGGTIALLGATIFGFGLSTSITKYIVEYSENPVHLRGGARKTMKIGFLSGTIGALILVIVSLPLCKFVFHQPELAPIMIIVSFSIPITILMNIASGISLGLGNVKHQVIVNSILLPLIWTAFVALVWYKKLGLSAMALTIPVSTLVAASLATWFVLRSVGAGPADMPEGGVRQIVSIGLILFVSSLAYTVWLRMDTLALGAFWGPSEVGLYTPAFQASSLLTYMLVAVSSLFSPTVTSLLAKNEKAELGKLFKEMSRWCFYGNIPIALTLYFGAAPFLGFFGRAFVTDISIMTLRVLLAFFLFYSLVGAMPSIVLAMGGQHKNLAKLEILMVFIAGVLHLLLTRKLGIIGAALASGCSLAVVAILRTALVKMVFGFLGFDRTIWKGIVTVLVGGLIIAGINTVTIAFPALIRLLILAVASVLVEISLLLIMRDSTVFDIINVIVRKMKTIR